MSLPALTPTLPSGQLGGGLRLLLGPYRAATTTLMQSYMYVGLARPRPARGAWWHGRGRAPAAAADRIGILYHLRQWRSQWIHKTTVNSNTDRMQSPLSRVDSHEFLGFR